MSNVKTKYIILASGVFLTEYLTKELIEGDEDAMLEWMEDKLVNWCESWIYNLDGLYEIIHNHAWCIQEHFESRPDYIENNLHSSEVDPKLLELIKKSKYHVMPPEQAFEQRVSFVYGQMMDCNPDITKDHIRSVMKHGASKYQTET